MPTYRSRTTTQGRNMAGARALWRATGMKDGDFEKPIIAVVNSFTQFVPGHVHLKDLGQMVAREIEAAGGLQRWRPATPHASDLEREAWQWLARRDAALPVHCWYGREDRFLTGQRRLAATLDPACVHECAGGHDWPAWRAYWDGFLEESRLVTQ